MGNQNKTKTVIIAAFQAVAVKNIVRSGVTDLLLASGVRVVILVRNQTRVDYYKAEPAFSGLDFEAVDAGKYVDVIDWFFSKLKYVLLKTESTDMRRRWMLEESKHHIFYYWSVFINWCLARPLIRKVFRSIDYGLVRTHIYEDILKRYAPDLIFLTNLFEEADIHLLREAKRRGIITLGFINSWDKVTARSALRLLPDKLLVYNKIVKEELILYDDVPEEDIEIVGIPQCDFYFDYQGSNRERFFKKFGLDPEKKMIVCAPMGSAYSNSDWDIIDLIDKNVQDGVIKGAELLVRFQPNDFFNEVELARRPWIRYQRPGTRFSPKRGGDWDMNQSDLNDLRDTLYHLSLLVCYASSLSVDAAMFDKPVINVNFEFRPSEIARKSPTYIYEMVHYKNALRSGGIRLVNDSEELTRWVNSYLVDPSLDREGRERLVREQSHYTDGRSVERIAKIILKYAHSRN